jgi:hypothetical protein
MLMTKYKFFTMHDQIGNHTVVTRLEDGAQKYFFQAGADNTEGITKFLKSMTDELTEGYFPKAGKKGGSPADNWAFIGNNPGRQLAEQKAKEQP